MTKNVQLQRGASCLIKADESKVEDIIVELVWTVPSGIPFEVDACAFLLTDKKTVRDDRDFIFYNQPASADGSVVLNPVSKNSRKKSEFYICLAKLPAEIVRIVIAVTIYQAAERQQNFSMVKDLYLNIVERGSAGQQIACYQVPDANEDITLVLGHIYRVQDEWKLCAGGQGFRVGLDLLASKLGVDIQSEKTEQPEDNTETEIKSRRGRRSTADLLEESVQLLQEEISRFLPQINAAVEQKDNESKTRIILDRIFIDVFGYKIEEIKAEQKIQGKRADYVLSVAGNDILVVEVKKAGMNLRGQHISQAAFYGACSGIAWALLTNLQTWQIYYISMQEKVEHHLVFSVDLSSGPSEEDFKNLVLISRDWINKRNLLEKLWNETRALRSENIVQAVLTEEVISKIRIVVNRDNGCSFTNEQIKEAVERILPAT
jgi:stress response protein SCP2/predicted type IV restriction endonuclease